jgi:hypothetical protein
MTQSSVSLCFACQRDCAQERLEFGGCKHSGDWYGKIRSGAFDKGGDVRETIEMDLAEVRNKGAAFIVVGVFSWGGQDMDEIPRAFTYVANPQVRGSGPGGKKLAALQSPSSRTMQRQACIASASN